MIITLLRLEYEATEPLSVSAPEAAGLKGAVDLPVAIDPWGEPFIPASGVAGAMRDHAREVLKEHHVTIFGSESAARSLHPEESLVPSPLRILGTRVVAGESQSDVVVTLRQTAISRVTGAAKDKSLRAREALAAGTRIVVYAMAEDLGVENRKQLAKVIRSWHPRLGGGGSWGLGTMVTKSLGHRELDLTKQTDLALWLGGDGPGWFDNLHWDEWTPQASQDVGIRRLKLTFRIDGDVRIGDVKQSQSGGDGVHAARSLKFGDEFVIPGSAWKGVFRSRAEFILRSCGVPTCHSTDVGTCGKPECATCELFGWTGVSRHASGRERGEGTGSRGRVRFVTTPVKGPATEQRTHVAIDRFTGGNRRGQLFTEEVLTRGTMSLSIELPSDCVAWAEPLFRWVALDIHDGYVGVGHGTARGMGSLKLTSPESVIEGCGNVVEALAQRRDFVESEGGRDV